MSALPPVVKMILPLMIRPTPESRAAGRDVICFHVFVAGVYAKSAADCPKMPEELEEDERQRQREQRKQRARA